MSRSSTRAVVAARRIGWAAVTLCTLPWLGFVPDDVGAAPAVAVARVAGHLEVDPGVLRHYGRRPKTRTDHLRLVARYRGWRVPALPVRPGLPAQDLPP